MSNPDVRLDRIHARQADLLLDLLQRALDGVQAGRPVDQELSRHFRQHKEMGSRDRRLYTESIFAYFRWKGWTDAVVPGNRMHALLLALQLDQSTLPPAARHWLDLQGIAPETLAAWVAEARRLPGSRLMPAWIPEELDPADLSRFIESCQHRPPTWLRVNRGKAATVCAGLGKLGVAFRQHPAMTDAMALERAINLDLLRREAGPCFEVQDLASQIVGLVCAPAPGASWLDVCSGSGGKSLHLADLMERRGSITATDVRASTLQELERRVSMAGAGIIAGTLNPDPLQLHDGVLVDAPCAGTGTWPRNPDARWRMSREALQEKAGLQEQILQRAAHQVKAGGRLVYAVCSITTRETVDITTSFLGRNKDFALDPFTHPLTGASTDGSTYVKPWEGPCDGMYMARFRRC